MRYRIDPERSLLLAEARSSLHPIRVKTSGFEGYVEIEPGEDSAQLGMPTQVELEASLLKSGNALLDRELDRRLEVRKFPQVAGEVREVKRLDKSGRLWLRGDLTFHGVTRSLETNAALRVIDDKTIELAGEKVIDMRDFDLTPPKLFIFRVHPEVKVTIRIIAAVS